MGIWKGRGMLKYFGEEVEICGGREEHRRLEGGGEKQAKSTEAVTLCSRRGIKKKMEAPHVYEVKEYLVLHEKKTPEYRGGRYRGKGGREKLLEEEVPQSLGRHLKNLEKAKGGKTLGKRPNQLIPHRRRDMGRRRN